ncbi:MAG TPA: glycosyltransferase family 2 protein [Solirubrobacteraceae bacterium]|nr:glycosyltransferase family 2 protein [Solirubrobacteraceae bacterium]
MSKAQQHPQAQVEIDVVVVAYRSGDTLRGCVEPLAALPHIRVTVVDNACPEDSTKAVSDLGVEIVRSGRNGGFSYGCNVGAARGSAPYVLFLNPDARIDEAALGRLVAVLRDDRTAALAAPRILDEDGSLSYSLRRFPRLRSTYAQALFLHRLWPLAAWTDELVRDHAAYERPGTPEWVSGACMLVRRSALAAIGGWDERFFLYCEDTDLCARLWDAGYAVRFEPAAEVRHVGGASSAVGETQAIAARSRVLYAAKHLRPVPARLEGLGVALSEATHVMSSVTRPASRRGHAQALRAALAA